MSSVVRLTPGHAHVAGQRRPLMAPVDDEIVPVASENYPTAEWIA
jgi:hypothetical protein